MGKRQLTDVEWAIRLAGWDMSDQLHVAQLRDCTRGKGQRDIEAWRLARKYADLI